MEINTKLLIICLALLTAFISKADDQKLNPVWPGYTAKHSPDEEPLEIEKNFHSPQRGYTEEMFSRRILKKIEGKKSESPDDLDMDATPGNDRLPTSD